jgi:hypothetical protein
MHHLKELSITSSPIVQLGFPVDQVLLAVMCAGLLFVTGVGYLQRVGIAVHLIPLATISIAALDPKLILSLGLSLLKLRTGCIIVRLLLSAAGYW